MCTLTPLMIRSSPHSAWATWGTREGEQLQSHLILPQWITTACALFINTILYKSITPADHFVTLRLQTSIYFYHCDRPTIKQLTIRKGGRKSSRFSSSIANFVALLSRKEKIIPQHDANTSMLNRGMVISLVDYFLIMWLLKLKCILTFFLICKKVNMKQYLFFLPL